MNDEAPPVKYGDLAGFWIRLLSDIIDGLILGLFGLLLSLPFKSLFLRLGERGTIIGLLISLAYAGVLQSRLGGGQTLAKRLLKLRVVKLDGTLLSLDRSLLRYVVVNFMVCQTAVALAVVTVLPFLPIQWLQTLFGTVALVLFLGCVVVVPFHPLKRGLHDLLAGTIVVRGGFPNPSWVADRSNPVRDRGILIGAGTLVVVSLVISVFLSRRPVELPGGITGPQSVVGDLPLQNAVITDGIELRGDGRTRTVMVAGFLPRPEKAGDPDLDRAHQILIQALRAKLGPDSGVDKIGTSLRTGFNIGIYSWYETQTRVEATGGRSSVSH